MKELDPYQEENWDEDEVDNAFKLPKTQRPTPYTNLPKKLWGPRRENDPIFKISSVNLRERQIQEILRRLSPEEIKELRQRFGDIDEMDPGELVYLIRKIKERRKFGYGFGEENELENF
jgi:hypothetical protein